MESAPIHPQIAGIGGAKGYGRARSCIPGAGMATIWTGRVTAGMASSYGMTMVGDKRLALDGRSPMSSPGGD